MLKNKTKNCTKCKVNKLLDKFHKAKKYKEGYCYRCKDCTKEYKKIWYQKNRQRILKTQKQYERKNKGKYKKYKKTYCRKYPLRNRYNTMKQRCNNPKSDNYKRYGGRGIKCLMTIEELEFLWFRDKAYNMKKPSIDRKDNDGHYELSNCRFMEMIDNLKKQHLDRKVKL